MYIDIDIEKKKSKKGAPALAAARRPHHPLAPAAG
jgi:hypothetical protein